MGRASESLMRPAVRRHHRSSRALTQDAPTLWDLLIFEIARPGMFIWRRGCRRESPPPPLPVPPPLSPTLSSNLPADISQLLPPRASRYSFFFLFLCIRPTGSPFLPSSRRRRLSSSTVVPTEKNAITLPNERGWCIQHHRSHRDYLTTRLIQQCSRNSSFVVLQIIKIIWFDRISIFPLRYHISEKTSLYCTVLSIFFSRRL